MAVTPTPQPSVRKNFGAAFWLAAADGTLTKVASVLSVKAPSLERGTVDITTHDSPEGIMEFMGEGVADPGAGTVTLHRVPGSAGDMLILEALESGQNRNFKIVANGASGAMATTGQIILTSYEPDDAPVQGKQAATLGFKASGKLTYGADQ